MSERAKHLHGIKSQPQSCFVSAGGKDRDRWNGTLKSELI